MYVRPDKLAGVEKALVRAQKRRARRQPKPDPQRILLMGQAIRAIHERTARGA